MKRNELNDLLAFAAVADERSFTRAAARLGLSASALSHSMRALETRHGVRLLNRTTRSVAPSEAGERLLASLKPAFAGIEAGLGALCTFRDAPVGRVRITTFAAAVTASLAPRLPAFLAANPGVEVEVAIDNRPVDIVAAGFDAGIRFGENVARDMIAVRIGPDQRSVVVGTPDYLARHGTPRVLSDLQSHPCVRYRMPDGSLLPFEFTEGGRDTRTRPNGPLIVNEMPLALATVRAGVALGSFLESEVEADISAGRLVPVLGEWCESYPGFYLYHPSRRQTPPALRALIEALRWRG